MSAYIKLSTLEYPLHEGDIRLEHPEILESQTGDTFPCPDNFALVYMTDYPSVDRNRYNVTQSTPEKADDGKWYHKWVVTPIPNNILAGKVRTERNKLLSESDWTQVADAPVDKTAWATYRQALRDVPAQPGFPWDIIWPTQP